MEQFDTGKTEHWHEITLVKVKGEILENDFQEALRLARLRYEGLQKLVQSNDEQVVSKELEALTEEIDDVRKLYDPLGRLQEIADILATENELGSQTTSDLLNEADIIKTDLKLSIADE